MGWLGLGLLLPGFALALGLGEARVNSYLNQPLDARIHLIDVDEQGLDSLTVRPGSAADYQRVGLDPAILATPLEVTVDRSVTPPVIRVTSARPITEPVVQMLIYARWNSGRVLREYTLFLDPPLIDIAPTPAVRPVAESSAPVREIDVISAVPALAEPVRRVAESPAEPVAGSGHRVEAGDTLWSIAYRWRPDGSVSMNQVMLAFQQANPHAFADGNVNRLQRGAELQFPDLDAVREIDVRRAEQEIQAQMLAWHSQPAQTLPVVSDRDYRETLPMPDETVPTDAVSAQSPAMSESTAPAGRLSLMPPDSGEDGTGDPLGDPDAQAEIRRLRGVLAETEEELAGYSFETREISARVNAFREGIQAREQALGITDSELADLEDALRAARLAAAEQAALAAEQGLQPVHAGELGPDGGVGPASSEFQPARSAVGAEPVEHAAAQVAEAVPPGARSPADGGAGWKRWIWLGVLLAFAATSAIVFRVSRGHYSRTVPLDDARALASDAADESADPPAPPSPRPVAPAATLPQRAPDEADNPALTTHSARPATAEDVFAMDDNEAEVKLELAQACLSIDDHAAARALLAEVENEGNAEQRQRAQRILMALKQ